MTLDVCLEVSGAYAHLVGVDTVNSLLFNARLSLRRRGSLRAVHTTSPDRFERRLSAAIDRLPLLLAHVLWLVDVCGCTYETAAAELGSSPERVAGLVVEARRRIRDEVVSGPRRSPEGSTSRSRPGWPRPGH